MATLNKPTSIAKSPFRSSKWDEITAGRSFQQSDAPIIALLCQWYEVVEKCMDDLDYDGEIRVAYQNDIGDIKAFPQLATMKQATAEIRALNKQLGINDEAKPDDRQKELSKLVIFQKSREAKAARSA